MVNFRIDVVVNPKGAVSGTRTVERRLKSVQNRSDLLRKSLTRTFGYLAGGAVVVGAVRSMAQFEESIATVRAVTKATGNEFEALRDRALELGAATRFSATQAADALVSLSRAGFSVTESIESVDDTLKLAQAASLGLAQASDITASAIRGFRLSVSEASRVTDVLVETANRANTDVAQLGEGLKFVAPVAAALGRSIEETAAAMGVLSDAGLKGSLAGTGLRRVLAELASPSDKLRDLLERTGLAVADVNPQMNRLSDVMQTLAESGIDTGEALEIFGQRGGPAFLNLVANVPKLQRLNQQLENSQGVANKVADTLDQTLNGALFRTRSALDAVVQSLGQAGASDFLVSTLDGISAAMRALADNMEVVTSVATAMAVVIGMRTLGAAFVASQSALRAFSLSMVLFRGNVLAATAAMIKMNVASLANPWLAAAAAITVAVVALKKYVKEMNEVEKVYEQIENDARKSFNSQGHAIRRAQVELNNYVRLQEKQGFLSESQRARVEQLRRAIFGERKEIRKAAEKQQELNDAQARSVVTVDNLLMRLDRQADALRDITRETEIQQKAQAEVQKLLQAGVVPTSEQREEIQNRIARNEALKDQRKLLEEIKGPQERFQREQDALSSLLKRGAITSDEYTSKLRELKDSLSDVGASGGVAGVDENSLDRLRETVELLKVRTQQGELAAEQLALENALRAEGVQNVSAMSAEIGRLLAEQKKLTDQARAQRDAEKDADRASQRESRQLDRLASRINGTSALADEQRRLNQLYADGRITADQLAQAQNSVTLRSLQSSTALEDGFTRAFLKMRQEAENFAAVGDQLVGAFADKATDAIVNFVETGKFSFEDFTRSILSDIVKIITRLLVVQSLSAAFGGVGGFSGIGGAVGSLAGGRQEGGTVQPGRSYLVGENGPEIFQSDRTGTVIPNPADQPAVKPEVRVQVVNVTDPDEVPQAINGGRADDAIVNAISRNRDRVSRELQ